MITRIILFLIGFVFMIIGFSYFIVYINLLSFGYNIIEYLNYCFTRYECWLLIIGLFIISIIILRKGGKHAKCL